MEYVVTAEEMRSYDNYTINQIGMPAMVLMERAALQIMQEALEHAAAAVPEGRKVRVLVAAGSGNNGGDGLAAARLLADRGCLVETVLIGEKEKLSIQAAEQLKILQNYGMSVGSNVKDAEYDIIVDALLGVGLNRTVEGRLAAAISRINAMDAFKIAVDIPSGIDAGSGKVLGAAVKADVTVTFGFLKRGLLLYPGAEYAGRLSCVDIGIKMDKIPEMYTFTGAAAQVLPDRAPGGNKGTFGKVLLIAGSRDMAGAALLAGESALRAGAGMVRIVTCEENRVILQERLPEAMLLTLPCEDMEKRMEQAIAWADAVVAGPGTGREEWAEKLLMTILEQCGKPLVADADALNLLAEREELQTALQRITGSGTAQVVLTPHIGELARLLSCTVEEVLKDPLAAVKQAGEKYHCTVAGKDARTFVYEKGRPVFLNTAGNCGMATAGSGDVLSGIIAAFLAARGHAYESAVSGVYFHACAGDLAAAELGEAGMTASDILRHMTGIEAKRD